MEEGRGKVQAPENWFFQSFRCFAHLRPSISLVLFVLCLKLFPTPWATRSLSPWALPGWWFLQAGPCWWWPGTAGGHKPDGMPPSLRQAWSSSPPVMSGVPHPWGWVLATSAMLSFQSWSQGRWRQRQIDTFSVHPPPCRAQLGVYGFSSEGVHWWCLQCGRGWRHRHACYTGCNWSVLAWDSLRTGSIFLEYFTSAEWSFLDGSSVSLHGE